MTYYLTVVFKKERSEKKNRKLNRKQPFEKASTFCQYWRRGENKQMSNKAYILYGLFDKIWDTINY